MEVHTENICSIDGCNALILPARSAKRKRLKKGSGVNQSKLHKRKMKLEEEKEKAAMLSKSFEIFEKCMIPEEAYPLLQSSKNLNRAQTLKEKRIMAFQFSKAGLQLADNDLPAQKGYNDLFCESEVFNEKSLSLASYENQVSGGKLVIDSTLSPKHCTHMQEDASTFFVDSCNLESSESFKLQVTNMHDDKSGGAHQENELSYRNLPNDHARGACSIPVIIHVARPEEMENHRNGLPIVMMEQEIMEAVNEHATVIICGETGCGKSTQVPQFLYEAGFGSSKSSERSGAIGITQPRRIAVLSTARRVALELGLRLGKEVGFQIRHDKMIGDGCSIKFMTDGILLREIQTDILLRCYSVVVLDEAHERSVNTDILIGLLSRVILLRKRKYEEQQSVIVSGGNVSAEDAVSPLKLVLMSATMKVEDFNFERVFQALPPVIQVPSRQFPVTVHFAKKTEVVDYINEARRKVLWIHRRLPRGGVLVFVTGKREVEYLCRKLRKAAKNVTPDVYGTDRSGQVAEALEIDQETDHQLAGYEEDEGGVHGGSWNLTSLGNAFESLAGRKARDFRSREGQTAKYDRGGLRLRVLPLYAMLPAAAQLRVFEVADDDERLVVVSTNVAETSLTIPGIKYVVDAGREKVKRYNLLNGMETYEIEWISKASAAQRAGRAGRTCPGHCYRLYSSAVYLRFPDSSSPQISRLPADNIVLLLKSMNIDNVGNFPFPTPLDSNALGEGERCLRMLSALDCSGKLTPLGKAMSCYPISPRSSRMLLAVVQSMREARAHSRANLVLGYGVAVAAALGLDDPFLTGLEECQSSNKQEQEQDGGVADVMRSSAEGKSLKERRRLSRERFSSPMSDVLGTAHSLQCFEASGAAAEAFCAENSLCLKIMQEMSKLRKQILRLLFSRKLTELPSSFSWPHGTLDDVEKVWRDVSPKKGTALLLLRDERLLCRSILVGWADRVAKRTRINSLSARSGRNAKAGAAVPYQSCAVEEPVFLHHGSSLADSAPEFLVYRELVRKKERAYVRGATSVEAEWLVECAASSCSFSTVSDPQPYYEPYSDRLFRWAVPTFGPHLWQLPLHAVPIPCSGDQAKVFAYALLQGRVLSCLTSVSEFLVLKPGTMLDREAAGDRRVGNLLFKLEAKSIYSRRKLRDAWSQNPRELYPEIMDWFQKSFRIHFPSLWLQMLAEAHLEPHHRNAKRINSLKKSYAP